MLLYIASVKLIEYYNNIIKTWPILLNKYFLLKVCFTDILIAKPLFAIKICSISDVQCMLYIKGSLGEYHRFLKYKE